MYLSLHYVVAIIASFSLTILANPIALRKRAACTDGAVVFAVRGSDPSSASLVVDPQYADIGTPMTAVANAVISKAGGGSLIAIQYPAVFFPTVGADKYQTSVNMGIQALQGAVLDYANSCPNGRIFIMGYSQGAQVVSAALGGSPSAGPLKAHDRVTGVVTYADPGFQAGVFPIDSGSAASSGVSGTVPGQSAEYQYLNKYFATRLRAYCQAGDAFCNSGNGQGGEGGPNAQAIHNGETGAFQDEATAWLTSLV